MRLRAAGARGADGGADEARSPSRSFYRLQKSTNPHIGPSSRDFSDDAQTACDICLQKSTKIYMRTCARGFRRGRPSAHYKAARNGPAQEKERHFGAFSLPRSGPFPSPVFRSAGPRSDRRLDRASDSGPFPARIPPDPDSVRPATDPASRRYGFYRADPGMPDPPSLDRASASPIPDAAAAIRSDAESALPLLPRRRPIRSNPPARPTRFDGNISMRF